nr:orphan sodium- and chloride-dependent neurotransmitter transporter NTT5-like isoform X1 [Microcebus murinus]XP_012609930.1 orphan sodium- and chloride-dependent neurotransmitter transporter NTT5-like isoform X1 [Microcebus murinus]XP_012609931.1 orphan sodium- and chloride-dependent neurotransmitter transporter NTT5-like isoform X1 [Microcebus murinus]
MEFLGELSNKTEEEHFKKLKTSSLQASLPWKLKAKDIRATIPQHYLVQTKQTENLLLQVAFSVGLGSIWRYPYLCQRNGGGNFILIHFFMLLLFGIPLLYMEMTVGQWLHVNNIQAWKQLVPWLGGVGYASILVCTLMSLYNSTVVSWSLSYLSNSFSYPLPWDYCPLVKNISVTDYSCLRTVTQQYFWYQTTLQASGHIEEGVEGLVLNLTLGIFAAWVVLFLIMITGTQISMPLLFLQIFLPYILLFCFFIRGLFLENAVASLRRMVTTELSALASLDLWRQAGGHVLYSLSLGMGTIVPFSSYNAGGNDCIKLASIVALVNLVTSLLTTSIVFIVLGFWAATSGSTCVEKNVSMLMKLISKGLLPPNAKPPENILLMPPIDYLDWISTLPTYLQYQVIQHSLPCSIKVQEEQLMEGPGLAFAAFSQAVSLFPGSSSFWAIIFFLSLLIIELATLIKIAEAVIIPLQNSVSTFIKNPKLVPVLFCLGGFLGSLVFTSHAGSYILSLFDDLVVPLTLVITVTFQNMALAWIYGARRFREELFNELGRLLWPTFTFLWCQVTLPGLLALLGLCIAQLYHKVAPYYIAWNSSASQEVKQPYLKRTLGWVSFLSLLTFLPIAVHPLQHWWYFENPIVSNTLEKPLTFKKASMVPRKPVEWPKPPEMKSTLDHQQNDSEDTLKEINLSPSREGHRSPWRAWKRSSQNSFILSVVNSMLSMRSSTMDPSRLATPDSDIAENSEVHSENDVEENLPDKSVQ